MLTLRPFPKSAAIAEYYESIFKETERERAARAAGKSGAAKAVALISQPEPYSGDPDLHLLILTPDRAGAARPVAPRTTGEPSPVRR